MTPVSHGKPCAGNPHARFDEGASASEEPRRKALLHDVAALTFRAEKEMIEAIRAYSAERGQSVNAALKEIIAPVVGFVRRCSASQPRNNLARFCGALKDVDCAELEESQKAFSKIDEEMWK